MSELPTTTVSQDDVSDNEEEEVEEEEHGDRETMTCNALCSLGSSGVDSKNQNWGEESGCFGEKSSSSHKCCPKQLQLPMFLSKTFHMIDKCDSEIATWSEEGDNFVVKNVEKFAGVVLPLYFKHSNFSSFARQLNFYGFRKLRSEAILTSEVDPSSTCYVRFYHENFQRDKPELLVHIKRATKGDQQSKDDLDTLRSDITTLKEMLRNTVADYDRKLAELSYECNRRISSMNAEYDKLAALVQHFLGVNVANGGFPQSNGTAFFINGANLSTSLMPAGLGAPSSTTPFPPAAVGNGATATNTALPAAPPNASKATPNGADMLRSLSQAAELHENKKAPKSSVAGKRAAANAGNGGKKKSARLKREDASREL